MFEGLVVLGGYLLVSVALDRRVQRQQVAEDQVLRSRIPELLRRAASQIRSGQSTDSAVRHLVTSLGGACPDGLAISDWIRLLNERLGFPELLHLRLLVDHVLENGGDLANQLDEQAARLQNRLRARSLAVVAMAPVLGQARLVLFIIPALVGWCFCSSQTPLHDCLRRIPGCRSSPSVWP